MPKNEVRRSKQEINILASIVNCICKNTSRPQSAVSSASEDLSWQHNWYKKKPTSSNKNHQCSASNPDNNHILKRCVKLEAVYVDILVRGGVITGVYWDTGFMRGFWLCPSLITPLCRGPPHVSGTPQCVCVSLCSMTRLRKLMFAALFR